MALDTAKDVTGGAVWGALAALIDTDGSAAVASARALVDRRAAMRDVADAVHGLCLLHGRQPGVIDHAAASATQPITAAWFTDAIAGFAAERAYIVRLVAAAGPLPSTPGQAESESAIGSQRHALEMLAASERPGCAIGAAVALVLDWPAARAVLDNAAVRIGLTYVPLRLPDAVASAAMLAALPTTAAFQRAALFGAQQTLEQHRGLWALLEARAAARDRA